jgi:hypothetical protein
MPPIPSSPAVKKPLNAKQSYSLMVSALTARTVKPFRLGILCNPQTGVADRIVFKQGIVGSGTYTNSLTTTNLANPQGTYTNLPVGSHLQFIAEAQLGTNKTDSAAITFSGFAWATRLAATGVCFTATSLLGPWTRRTNYALTITNGLTTGTLWLKGKDYVTNWIVVLP